MSACPCCGGPVSRPYGFDHSRNMVATPHGSAALSPLQADILAVLDASYPRGIKRSSVIARVYGHRVESDLPTDPDRVLGSKLTHIRQRIRPLGLDIKSVGGTVALVAIRPALSDNRAATVIRTVETETHFSDAQSARVEAYERSRRYV